MSLQFGLHIATGSLEKINFPFYRIKRLRHYQGGHLETDRDQIDATEINFGFAPTPTDKEAYVSTRVKFGRQSALQIITGAIAVAAMAVPGSALPAQHKHTAEQVAQLRGTTDPSAGRFTSKILTSLLSTRSSVGSDFLPYCQFTQCPNGCTHTQTCTPTGGLGG
jgi:hypothetical protein